MKAKLITLAGIAGLLALLPSCESTTASASPGSEAVMCDKCKTVWVKQNLGGGPAGRDAVIYRDAKVMSCPDCQLAVNTFWKTGQIKHTCSHCGGTLSKCTLCSH